MKKVVKDERKFWWRKAFLIELPGNKATVSNGISVSVVTEAISTYHIMFVIFKLDVTLFWKHFEKLMQQQF